MALCLGLVAAPATAQSPPGLWQELRPEGGGFSAEMPGTALSASGETRSQQNELLATSTFFEIDVPGGRAYQINYSDLKPALRARLASPDDVLGNARDLSVQRARGRLRSDHAITLDGNPGREVIIAVHADDTNNDLAVKIRYYLVRDRLYQITAVGPPTIESDADVTHFFNSFRLVSAGKPGGIKSGPAKPPAMAKGKARSKHKPAASSP